MGFLSIQKLVKEEFGLEQAHVSHIDDGSSQNRPTADQHTSPKKFADHICCGMDEAGRGPWAGPLVVAGVILPNRCQLPGLNDSKLLTAEHRERLHKLIIKKGIVGIGMVPAAELDEIGLAKAIHVGYQRAFESLLQNMEKEPQANRADHSEHIRDLHQQTKIDLAFIDGKQKMQIPVRQKCIIKGDRKVRLIAAASVVAKVERDRIMIQIAKKHPGYGFQRHKGYGTRLHQQNLAKLGPSEIHRKSFAPVASAFIQSGP